jgi:molybdate/tungstate transport system substrate-binding protein
MTRTGKSCTYGITLIKNAPNQAGAVMFLEYLLSPEGGLQVLKEMGQPPFTPCRVPDAQAKQRLPKTLQGLVEISQ